MQTLTMTPGERAYAADREAAPCYASGAARATWRDLLPIARDSWERNPTPRSVKIFVTDCDDESEPPHACTFGAFMVDNADGIDAAEAAEIWRAIADGGTYHGGGGAAATFRVWLATSTPEAPR